MHGLPNLKICIAKQAKQIFHYKRNLILCNLYKKLCIKLVSIKELSEYCLLEETCVIYSSVMCVWEPHAACYPRCETPVVWPVSFFVSFLCLPLGLLIPLPISLIICFFNFIHLFT